MPKLVILSLLLEASPEALALGAASVAAAVLRADPADHPLVAGAVEVELMEADLHGKDSPDAEALVSRALAASPDWLGLSLFSWNRRVLLDVAALAKRRCPRLVVFAGGPEASADPLGLLGQGCLDFVVRGEGEGLVVQALEMLIGSRERGEPLDAAARQALADLPGIAAIGGAANGLAGDEDGIMGALALSPRALPEDLSRLPSPWLAGLVKPREGGVLWELARGCPFRCAYCYEGKGDRGIRHFPKSRIEAELDLFVRQGVRQAFVLDPTFDADRVRAKELLSLIGRKARGIHWKFEMRAELLDRDLAAKFAALDCSLQIGLQSADPEVSGAVGRPLDLKAFSRGVGYLNEAGVVFGIDLIYGLPKDKLAGFSRSLDFALGFQPNHLDIFPLSLLPGTELAERAAEFGLEAEAEPPYRLMATPGFPPEALRKAERLARATEIFYSRGRAVSWFLQALRPLRARPSAFLARFASSRGDDELGRLSRDAPAAEIEAIQLAFLGEEYRGKGLEPLLPALGDVVRFNGAWGRAIAEGEATEIEFSYDPEDVLGPAALDLAAFAREARPRRGRWRVAPGRGGPELLRSGGAAHNESHNSPRGGRRRA